MAKLAFMAALTLFSHVATAKKLVASWYEYGHHTANGESYHPNWATAAHKTYPFNTRLLLQNGKRKLWVRVNDRGPFVKGRAIDLSRGSARVLGIVGVQDVELIRVELPVTSMKVGARL